jgi:hypothetical protein
MFNFQTSVVLMEYTLLTRHFRISIATFGGHFRLHVRHLTLCRIVINRFKKINGNFLDGFHGLKAPIQIVEDYGVATNSTSRYKLIAICIDDRLSDMSQTTTPANCMFHPVIKLRVAHHTYVLLRLKHVPSV